MLTRCCFMLFCVYIVDVNHEEVVFDFFFNYRILLRYSFSGWMYIKGVPFSMEGIRKGYLFCQRCYIKW